MRETYYQSVGNPLQADRLPTSEPTLEFLAPLSHWSDSLKRMAISLGVAAMAVGITLLAFPQSGIAWLEPYDWGVALPAFLIGIFIAIWTGQIRWLLHPMVLVAVILICANHRTPWLVQVIVLSHLAGLLTFTFALHWCTICTAAPMSRQDAYQLREQWQFQLIALSLFAMLLTTGVLWISSPLLKLAVLILPVVAVSYCHTATGSSWHVLKESLVSWFTYEAEPRPGLQHSPVGPPLHRVGLVVAAAVLTVMVLSQWTDSPIQHVIEWGSAYQQESAQTLTDRQAGTFEQLRHAGWILGSTLLAVLSLPFMLPLGIALSCSLPILALASAARNQAQTDNGIETILSDIWQSLDETERNSVYLGRVVEDGSPVLVPREVFREHAHGLGDSGSGKTSLFLSPLIEQLVCGAECSVVVIDLKADSLELLAALQAAAQAVQVRRGTALPLKYFSNQLDRSTYAFNPLTQPYWSKFDLLTRTDILCGATGLTYGTDYGEGFYGSANSANVFHTQKTFPHVTTFVELADCLGEVLTSAKKRDLHPEIRKAGVHAQEVFKRLAACEALNVSQSSGHPKDVVDNAIDLTDVFRTPQLLYFHLSSTLSPSGAPEIARLVTYMLLAAATQTERKHPVFLVIDEFQRMVASNLEYMLQLARSMGVGIILANQSMEDLKKSTTNLIPAIEANCRLRQWFSVSASDDQERLIRSSGLTVDYALGYSKSTSNDWKTSVTYSESEQVVSRFTQNDVLLTSDHPFRSFLRISRGAGYAQYGGLPVIIQSGYHISVKEYDRRRALPWPVDPGSFQPRPVDQPSTVDSKPLTPTRPNGPKWSDEIIGEDAPSSLPAPDLRDIEDIFRKFQQNLPENNAPEEGKQP